jgi:hypothetical protein
MNLRPYIVWMLLVARKLWPAIHRLLYFSEA